MKKQQRSEAQAECASSAKRKTSWKEINFARCERKVRKLQIRIAKAQKERSYNKVKALQHLLVTSFEAKVLAVRKVTANNMEYLCQEDKRSEFFETERLQSSPTEKGQHTKEERKDETARDSNHERQSHAGSLSDGLGTHYGDNR